MNRCRFRRRSIGLASGLSLLLSLAAAQSDTASPTRASWPMFRGGPALLGVSPVTVPKELALLWSFKTQGPVKSSAAITGGRAFIGSDDGRLYALDLSNGKKIWDFKTESGVESSPL